VFPGTNLDNIADKMAKHRHRGARGEKCKTAILKAENIPTIRDLHARGMIMKNIAAKFGVGWKAIQKVINRTNWAHIP
jgi:hypothetical protein